MTWVAVIAGMAVVAVLGYGALRLSGSEAGDPQPPVGSDCSAAYPIKGNAESGIYHAPGWRHYKDTKPEECFASAEDAEAAGYRESEVK
jgi:hypothetical protein